MRQRAPAPHVVCLAAAALALAPLLTGCAAGVKKDAEAAGLRVAESVEREHRRQLASLTMLASADDGVVVIDSTSDDDSDSDAVAVVASVSTPASPTAAAPAAAARAAAPAAAVPPPAGGDQPVWLESAVPSFSFTAASHPYTAAAADAAGRPRGDDNGKSGLPNLRFQLMKFEIHGRPVDVKCTIRDKRLVFGAKIRM